MDALGNVWVKWIILESLTSSWDVNPKDYGSMHSNFLNRSIYHGKVRISAVKNVVKSLA